LSGKGFGPCFGKPPKNGDLSPFYDTSYSQTEHQKALNFQGSKVLANPPGKLGLLRFARKSSPLHHRMIASVWRGFSEP
jgi:hypothetical protein